MTQINLSILIWGWDASFLNVQVNHNTLIHLGGNREADDELTLVGRLFASRARFNPVCINLSW